MEAKLLHRVEVRFLGFKVDAVGDLRSESVKWVHVALTGLKKALSSLTVVLESAWRHLV